MLSLASMSIHAQVQSSKASAVSSENPIALESFQVTSARDKGYGTSHALGAARLNIAVLDTPMTVVTLNEEFLKDAGATDWVEAAKYVSGVNIASSSTRTGQISMRGYNATDFVSYRDGLNDPGFSVRGQAPFDPFTVDRLEFIKGAAGVLYGSHSLGGLVNRVSKMPQKLDRTALSAYAGSFEFRRLEIDTQRKVNEHVSYRLVAAIQEGELEWGGADDRLVINPTVLFTLGNVETWVRVDIQKMNYSGQASSWFTDSAFNFSKFMPRGSNLDEINEDLDQRKLWMYEVGARTAFEWKDVRFASRLVLRHNETAYNNIITDKNSFTFIDAAGQPLRTAANAVRTTRNTTFAEAFANPNFHDIRVARGVREQGDDNSAGSVNLDLTADFAVGPTKHKVLSYLTAGRSESIGHIVNWSVPTINALRPVYSSDPQSQRTNPQPNTLLSGSTDPFSWAWGLTDQIYLFDDRLILVGGARYDNIRSVSTNLRTNAVSRVDLTNWSYRYGALFKVHPKASLFANHSETFQGGAGGVDSFGNRGPTTTDGVSEEVGVKLDLMDGRFTFTASYFDMTLSPFVTLEFVPGTSNRIYVNQGANVTRGYEADIAWQPNQYLTLLAGYGDLTSRSPTGTRFRHVAEGPNYKLFAKFKLPKGRLKGLSFGGGYQYTPDRAGDAGDTFTLPSFDTMDAFAAYARGAWAFRVNVSNVTNEYLAVMSINRDRLTTLDPRIVRTSVSYSF